MNEETPKPQASPRLVPPISSYDTGLKEEDKKVMTAMQHQFDGIVESVAAMIGKGIEQGVSEYLSHPGREREERLAKQVLELRDLNTKERWRFMRCQPLFAALADLHANVRDTGAQIVTAQGLRDTRKRDALVARVVAVFDALQQHVGEK